MHFQIVIPTFNRADIVGGAIKTVLAQEYPNWSLLVVDNNSVDNTEDVVRSFDDSRIEYIRNPVSTSMCGNWEFGLQNIKESDAYTYLGDDDGLLPNALAVVEKVFREHPVEAVRVDQGCFTYPGVKDDHLGHLKMSCSGDYSVYNSTDVLKSVLCFKKHNSYRWLPSIYNSFYSSKLLESIMSCSGSRVFNSVSPDVYTGILAGGLGIDYAYLSFPTKFPGTSPKSNGVLVRKAGVDGIMPSRAKEFYEATLNEGLFSHMTNLVLSHVWDSTSKVKKLLPSLDIALDAEAFYNAAIKEILAMSRVLLEEDVRFLASVTPKNENDIRDHITSLFEARVKRERQRKVRKALTFSKLRKRVWGKPKEESTSNRFHVDEWVENDSVQDIHDACMYLYRKFSPLPPVGAKVEDVLGLKT